MSDVTIWQGDCREWLPKIPSGSVDAVITDPPYAEIDRDYGRLTEDAWHSLMDEVVTEIRRVLTPSGSAVFVIQPNSEFVGRMRLWVWEFVVRWGKAWNLVQDVYWWNFAAPPTVHTHRDRGLTRPSLKYCVWLGAPDCYRDQSAVLGEASEATINDRRVADNELRYSASGHKTRHKRRYTTFRERGGVTPFNVLPISPGDASSSAGAHGHGAGTPHDLCDWWVRYIVPPGGIVLDPFMGSGTVPIAALGLGRKTIGIEQQEKYYRIAERRIERPHARARRIVEEQDDAPFVLGR